MRFMIIRKADAETEAGAAPSAELAKAMMDHHEQSARSGMILGGDGLHPSSRGARVKFSRGKPTVTDGPFAETKELIAGYTLIEAPSLEAAIAWAKTWPPLDAGGEVELEVRQVYELDELGDAFAAPELKAQHDRIFPRP
jgi:hypothetical protein